ncbi:hypothetical protein DNTS_011676 [Danionella cerebrum]|uniref:Metallo-beta-lactamase domain-containing protein n=1 Tax=Danionella cerebrum TaxID=2873325 RepID=A0A553P1E8_9TELE|nr:hypothetical protein DNTS_011676 [Danionella translucida]
MSMDVTFLGSGSAYPSPQRGASALVLRIDGESFLFDCGEGTQTQLMKSPLRASKISKVFISHLHGDHLFGLPGLLCTISMNLSPLPDRSPPLIDIFGPCGLRRFLRVSLQLSGSQLIFPYAVHELVPSDDQCPEEGRIDPELTREGGILLPQERPGRTLHPDPNTECFTLVDDKLILVKAFKLFHRIPSFGFSLEEKERPGRLNTELLKELGVKPGPFYGRLKNRESLTLDDGRVLTPSEVLDPPVKGRKVCVFGDCCRPVGKAYKHACEGADLLVHEATLEDGQQEKAVEHGHSTPSMAAAIAKDCGVKMLVLSHFSQRYKPEGLRREEEDEDDVTEMKRQAEGILQGSGTEVVLAQDFLTLTVNLEKRVMQ